jgi:hypothetical protein
MNYSLDELLDAHTEVLTQIRTTKNYSLFTKLKGNRVVNSAHVKKLRQSLIKNYIMEVPIIVVFNPDHKENGEGMFEIIDGQHRVEALIQEGLPITFVIAQINRNNKDATALDVVELLNTNNSEWDVTSFMGSKAALENQNYVRYKKMYDHFEFEHEIFFYIIKKLGGSINHDGFKKNLLVFDEKISNKVFEVLTWLKKYLPAISKYGKRYYLKALLDLYFLENVNLERLDNVISNRIQLSNDDDKFLQSASVRQSLSFLALELYNNNLRKNKIGITTLDRLGNKYKLSVES